MSDLRDLYQELVLDHGRRPRNQRIMEVSDAESVGYNPLCGDKIRLFLQYEGDQVVDVSFVGSGCAISMASISLLTQSLKGRSKSRATELIEKFVAMLTNEDGVDDTELESLGKLAVFSGVREFPVRVKCATLAWRTLEAALDGANDDITTE